MNKLVRIRIYKYWAKANRPEKFNQKIIALSEVKETLKKQIQGSLNYYLAV
ncbi:hypothetical protein A33Q_4675 [Indibacter alkaliphilus LW1]|uniref:Uncharacterized protein n=1 Tax=Indibacter alkaliphilus (strain CCUG 57479 / KCTC 22604 / LW1) TaxID=1189612 RepID=S2DGM7_INDAL|nr:hypothetical protein A33Q_4675 [Indibacter alkaliphilus LW1]